MPARSGGLWGRIVVAVAVGLVLTAGPADAQTGPIVMTVTPPSGPPGTLLTVSGDRCSPTSLSNEAEAEVRLELDGTVVASNRSLGDEAGNWTVQVQVPEDIPPDTVLDVVGQCIDGSAFPFESTSFGVEAPEAPPTPTPPTPAPPAAAPPSPAPTGGSGISGSIGRMPTAPLATPRAATPTFTG
jgi:hypothetical protein